MSREWVLYFDDLLDFCQKIESYTDGLTRETFEASRLNYDATLWNVQLIGEAAKKNPDEIREKLPDVPWRELVGMRNRLAHGYFGINNATLWHVIEVEVPKLQQTLQSFVAIHPELFNAPS